MSTPPFPLLGRPRLSRPLLPRRAPAGGSAFSRPAGPNPEGRPAEPRRRQRRRAAPALPRREAHRRRIRPLLPGRAGGRPPDPGRPHAHLAQPHQPGGGVPRRSDGDRQQPLPPAGSPFVETVSGFAAPIGTETLWEAARRQGKRVGVNSWPGADDTAPNRRADWGMAYTNTPDRPAGLVTIAGISGSPPVSRCGSAPDRRPRRSISGSSKIACG